MIMAHLQVKLWTFCLRLQHWSLLPTTLCLQGSLRSVVSSWMSERVKGSAAQELPGAAWLGDCVPCHRTQFTRRRELKALDKISNILKQRTWIKVCWQFLRRKLLANWMSWTYQVTTGRDPKVTLNHSLWNVYPENCLGDKISQGHRVCFSSLCHLWFKIEGIYDGLTFWSPGICVWYLTEGEKREKKWVHIFPQPWTFHQGLVPGRMVK